MQHLFAFIVVIEPVAAEVVGAAFAVVLGVVVLCCMAPALYNTFLNMRGDRAAHLDAMVEMQKAEGGRKNQPAPLGSSDDDKDLLTYTNRYGTCISTGQCRAHGCLDTATRTQHHVQNMGGT